LSQGTSVSRSTTSISEKRFRRYALEQTYVRTKQQQYAPQNFSGNNKQNFYGALKKRKPKKKPRGPRALTVT
jgi:hypothetical protein